MSNEELKPCPCCGGQAYISTGYCSNPDVWDGDFRRVYCSKCQLRQLFYSTDADAIAAWNSRAAPPVAEAIPARAVASIDSPEFRDLMEYRWNCDTMRTIENADRELVAHINAAMTAYGQQQREELQKRYDVVSRERIYYRERAEKAEAALLMCQAHAVVDANRVKK